MKKQITKIQMIIDILLLLIFFSVSGYMIYFYFFAGSPQQKKVLLENAPPTINIANILQLVKTIKPAPPSQNIIPASLSNNWKYITIHHSATGSGNSYIFNKNHKQLGFENGLGYHFIICNGNGGKDGLIEIGDRWRKQLQGGHLKGEELDEVSIGICLVGDFTLSMPTNKQLASLKSLIIQLQQITNIPDNNILPHKKMPGQATACPGILPVKEIVKYKLP